MEIFQKVKLRIRIMRILIVFIPLIILCFSCMSNRFCHTHEKYLTSNIDTTKEFKLKGKYCISSVKDTIIENDNAIVKYSVFDRINGKQIKNGVIWFYSCDTIKNIYSNQVNEKYLKPGSYIIEAWEVGYIGTKTKKIKLKENTVVRINFYLGTTLDF